MVGVLSDLSDMADFEVYEVDLVDGLSESLAESLDRFQLWYNDLEQAGVDRLYVAESDDRVIGFMTVNADRQCVAIEVAGDWLGKDVGTALVEEAWVFEPERNECPGFWSKMAALREEVA